MTADLYFAMNDWCYRAQPHSDPAVAGATEHVAVVVAELALPVPLLRSYAS